MSDYHPWEWGNPETPNAPPTPQIGPEHIEALGEAIELAEAIAGVRKNDGFAPAEAAEQRTARLAEIRAYLESL